MSESVTLFEMGPRDGLQNEKTLISTADKIRLVDLLSGSGLRKIEVTSFVSAKWVPQMADAADVMAGIRRAAGVSYAALTPNLQGLQGAMATRADEVAVFGSASEGFSRANINCSIAESLTRFAPVLVAAQAAGLPVRGYVSCMTDCPYDGPTPPESVLRVAKAMLAMGCYEVSLADTIGAATAQSLDRVLDVVLAEIPAARLAGHYHDTGGAALAHIRLSLKKGLRRFDAAVGGLGGCPYAPGAKGNVATEAVNDLLLAEGFATGIDQTALREAAQFARRLKGSP
jgi:hydroxymethylglutaryl-CoA lyase